MLEIFQYIHKQICQTLKRSQGDILYTVQGLKHGKMKAAACKALR